MRLDVLGLARALGAVAPAQNNIDGNVVDASASAAAASSSSLASSWLQSGAVLALHASSSLLAVAHGSNLALVPLGGGRGGTGPLTGASEQQQKKPKQQRSSPSSSSRLLSSHGLPLVVTALPTPAPSTPREVITALCFVSFARVNRSEDGKRRTKKEAAAAVVATGVPTSSSSCLEATDGCLLVGTSTGHLQLHSLHDLAVIHRQRLHSNRIVSIRARPAASGLEGSGASGAGSAGGGAFASSSTVAATGPGPAAAAGATPLLDDEDVTVVFLDAVARLAAADVASVARLASSMSSSTTTTTAAAAAGESNNNSSGWREAAAALPPLGMCKWQLSGVSAAVSAAADSAADGGNGDGGEGTTTATTLRDQRDGGGNAEGFRDNKVGAKSSLFFGSQRVDGICLGPRPPSLREALEADDDESSSGSSGGEEGEEYDEKVDEDDDDDDDDFVDDDDERSTRRRRRARRRRRRGTAGVGSRPRPGKKAPAGTARASAAASAAVGFGERSSGRALVLTVGGAPCFLALHDAAEHSPRGTLSLVADLAQSAAAGLRAAARAAVFSGRPGGFRAGIRQWVTGGGGDDDSSSPPSSSSAATTADNTPSPSRPQSASVAMLVASPSSNAAAAPMSLSPRAGEARTPSRPTSAAAAAAAAVPTSFPSPPPSNSAAVFEAARKTEKLEPPPRGETAPLWRCLADAEQRRAVAVGSWGARDNSSSGGVGGGSGSGGGSTLVSPQGCLVAVADSLGRVLLADASTGIVFRVWKGYRGAQVAWLLLPSCAAAPSSTSVSRPASANGRKRLSPERDQLFSSSSSSSQRRQQQRNRLLLVIYAPRRSLLEAWVPRPGSGVEGRVAALKCGGGGGPRARLLSPCPVLGLSPSSSRATTTTATAPSGAAEGECWLLDCESGEAMSLREAVASAIAASAKVAAPSGRAR